MKTVNTNLTFASLNSRSAKQLEHAYIQYLCNCCSSVCAELQWSSSTSLFGDLLEINEFAKDLAQNKSWSISSKSRYKVSNRIKSKASSIPSPPDIMLSLDAMAQENQISSQQSGSCLVMRTRTCLARNAKLYFMYAHPNNWWTLS